MGKTTINRKWFNFYVKHSKPQYESWNINKIDGLKVRKLEKVDYFLNLHFKIGFSNKHEADELTLADIPLMNPFHWISVTNIVSREPFKYQPIFSNMKRLIKTYIIEIEKMDIEISYVLKKNGLS